MKKELLVSFLALLVALVAAISVVHRGNAAVSANAAGECSCVSGLGNLVSSTEPGAWIVVGDSVYLLKAEYDYNDKSWTVSQLASTRLTSR
jgi:hypothetical protein